MNDTQKRALKQLQLAVTAATDNGLFDEMAAAVSHPDVINKFCDDLDEMQKWSEQPRPVGLVPSANPAGAEEPQTAAQAMLQCLESIRTANPAAIADAAPAGWGMNRFRAAVNGQEDVDGQQSAAAPSPI